MKKKRELAQFLFKNKFEAEERLRGLQSQKDFDTDESARLNGAHKAAQENKIVLMNVALNILFGSKN